MEESFGEKYFKSVLQREEIKAEESAAYMENVKEAKAYFVKTGKFLPIVRGIVADAWKQSVANGLTVDMPARPNHFIEPEQFEQICRKNRLFLHTASTVIDAIADSISDIPCCMQLFDLQGNLLYVNYTKEACKMSEIFPRIKAGYCALDNHGQIGAVAMALKYQRDISFYGTEHFLKVSENINCNCNVLKNHRKKTMGIIAVTYPAGTVNSLLPCVAGMLSSLIEQEFIEDRYRQILTYTHDNILEGILILDTDLNVLEANKKLLTMFDMKEEEIGDIDIISLFQEVDFRQFMEDEKETTLFIGEVTAGSKGHQIKVSLVISKIYAGDTLDGLTVIVRPIRDIIKLSQRYTAHSLITFEDIITKDVQMQGIIRECRRMAAKDIPVLIEGPSGTGKELFAQAIHNASARRDKPFVSVNCAALPASLVESELFGYEKGAFTGALSNGKIGKFEQADGGTIFLDEIGELPLDFQPKLLRILDNHRLVRVGSNKEKLLDIRVIAATNRDLYKETLLKTFRQDLYFRLNVFKVLLPALKDRKGDVRLLLQYFISKYNRTNGQEKYLDQEALEFLEHYSWPGNVRELQNAVMRAWYLTDTSRITLSCFPDSVVENTGEEKTKEDAFLFGGRYKTLPTFEENERELLRQALCRSGGNVKAAADLIQIPMSTFYRKMKQFHIEKKETQYQ